MSSITDAERRRLERLLSMESGYVLDFTNDTFGDLFERHAIDIHGPRYRTKGDSKAKKMRSFWEQDSDRTVGRVLSDLLESYEVQCEVENRPPDVDLVDQYQVIVARLSGQDYTTSASRTKEFLQQQLDIPKINTLPVEGPVSIIVEQRLDEIRRIIPVNAHLSVIMLSGSILEAVLLGAGQRDFKKFMSSTKCPSNAAGKAKPIQNWSLAQLIDVACDIRVLQPDIGKFSHGLRHFRNYIHPYRQMSENFTPDDHTAKVCFQVLKAALADIAGQRR